MSGVRTVSCPNCGGSLEVRAAGYSVSLGCRYCGSIVDISRPEVALIAAYNREAATFTLPPGVRGTLFGTEWQVIGALRRSDGEATWDEYLLFNPYIGYRWLVASEGEWQFGTMLLDRPEGDVDSVTWRGARYTRAMHQPDATTETVVGEFYWRVARGDRARCSSFERGNNSLSLEESDGEVNWTLLVPVRAREIESAFGLKRDDPVNKRRSLYVSRADDSDDLPRMYLISTVAAIMALVLMLVLAGPTQRAVGAIKAPFGTTREGQLIGTIAIARPWQFVTIHAQGSDFENRWVDIDYSIVDRSTGQSVDGYGLVEHYSGRDSDGAWSEGSRATNTQFGRLPRGTYDIYADAQAHAWPVDEAPQASGWNAPEVLDVRVEARTGSVPWGNFWTLLLLLMAVPLLVTWRRVRNQE